HGPDRLCLEIGLAAVIEENERVELDAHRLVEIDANAAEYVDELRMGAEPGAAAGEVLGIALENDRVPAGAAQEMGREQPAERAADHQGASCGHDWLGGTQAMAQDMLSWPGL